jgi:hypothetical protein
MQWAVGSRQWAVARSKKTIHNSLFTIQNGPVLNPFLFSNIPAFNAQLPLFSITFPHRSRMSKRDPLFSATFPLRSFIFKQLFFSFFPRTDLLST